LGIRPKPHWANLALPDPQPVSRGLHRRKELEKGESGRIRNRKGDRKGRGIAPWLLEDIDSHDRRVSKMSCINFGFTITATQI